MKSKGRTQQRRVAAGNDLRHCQKEQMFSDFENWGGILEIDLFRILLKPCVPHGVP
jgi:hypothetical protein